MALDYLTLEERAGAGRALDPGAHAADAAGGRGDGDAVGRPGRRRVDGGTTATSRRLSRCRQRTGPTAAPGRSSVTRPSVTTAATRCSGPDRATSARAAGRPAAARNSKLGRSPLSKLGTTIQNRCVVTVCGAAVTHRSHAHRPVENGEDPASATSGGLSCRFRGANEGSPSCRAPIR